MHVADTDPAAGAGKGGRARGLAAQISPDTAGPGLINVKLKAPKSGIGGIAGVLADRASSIYAAALQQKLNEHAGPGGSAGGNVKIKGGGDVVSAFRRAIQDSNADSLVALSLFEAGIVESGLKNLDYGDADSLGALQERVSIYGAQQAMNPYASAMRFIGQAQGKEPWNGTAGQLAQAVQVSAFPGRYDQVQAQARQYVGDGLGRLASSVRVASSSRASAVSASRAPQMHVHPGAVVIHAAGLTAGQVASEIERRFGAFAAALDGEMRGGSEEPDLSLV